MLSTSRIWVALAAIICSAMLGAAPVLAQETGSISGVVVDAATGESLPGANVSIKGTTTGTATDLNGRYTIKGVEVGTYDLVFSFIGFQQKTITGVEVTAGETTKLEVTLAEQTAELDEVIVEAEVSRSSDAGLLKERAKAAALSNAISAEEIGRSGAGNVADAMSKVTGATVLEGKYVNVRGLQGRYVSVQLNGTQLPSADPDGNSISLDIFPSDLLQNITTIKTFTPDQPGNFTGGSVDIRTKSFPDDLSVSFSASTSVNANIGLNGSLLNVEGGLDEIPDIVSEPFSLPSEVEISQNEEAANTMDAAARAFRQPAAPTTETVLANQSYDLSFGNQYEVGGMPLGVLASGTFSRGNSGYDSGLVARFQQTGAESDELRSTARYTSVRGESKTQYSGLLNVSLRPHPNHEVGVNTVYTRQNTDEARFQSGRLPRDLTGDQIFQTRTLRTVKRDVRSGQLRGEHLFKGLRGTRLEWNAALSRSTQDEPDYRFFSNHFRIGEADGDTTYTIAPSIYPVPARYFRDLQETNQSGDVSISIPVLDGNVKVGGSFLNKSREYRERRFDHRSGQISFSGDPNAYINEDAGLIGQSGGLFRFGTFLDDATQIQANYDGEQTVAAGFGMIDTAIPGLEAIRVIAGARVEHTDMTTENVDPATGSTAENGLSGSFTTTDILPSINVVGELAENLNLRAAHYWTIARPSFREFSPAPTFEFIGDYIELGNPDLTRTQVYNQDLRLEWFPRPGEILSGSVYFKRFSGPIERTISTSAAASNTEITYRNADYANVYGAELEATKRLDFISDALRYVSVNTNFSYIYSEVPISEAEQEAIAAYDPTPPDTRPLQGQSPYIINAGVSYENPQIGTSVSVSFNRFGERLEAAARNGVDLYERGRSTLDVLASQRMFVDGLKVSASVKNILNAQYEVSQDFQGQTFVNDRYPLGRAYSLGIKYEL